MRQAIYDLIAVVSDHVNIPIMILGLLTTLYGIQNIRGGQYIIKRGVSHQTINENWGKHWKAGHPAKTSRYSGGEAEANGRGYVIGGILILLCGLFVLFLAFWVTRFEG